MMIIPSYFNTLSVKEHTSSCLSEQKQFCSLYLCHNLHLENGHLLLTRYSLQMSSPSKILDEGVYF